MDIAKGIQQSLLPSSVVTLPWCQIAGVTSPASEVGGDYFDVFKLSDTQLAVVIADVSGHGVGAGILAAMTKSALLSQLNHNPGPVSVMENLNRTLQQVLEKKMFVTLAYVLLDGTDGTMTFATAGHPPLFHYRAQSGLASGYTMFIVVLNKEGRQRMQLQTESVHDLRTAGIGLCLTGEISFREGTVEFHSDDVLMLYTDGVTEAVNNAGEELGTQRLVDPQETSRRAGRTAPRCCHERRAGLCGS